MQIVIALEDLRLALKWAEQNSNDVAVRMEVDAPKLKLFIGTPDVSVVTITLFSSESAMQPKISTEEYLKHVVRVK